MTLQHFCDLAQSSEVPRPAEPEHRCTAGCGCTSDKRMTLVAQPIEAWWIDVLHESLDSVGSVQAGHFSNAMRNAVKLIDSTQQAGLRWISRRANGDEVLIISMNLSLNSWVVKA